MKANANLFKIQNVFLKEFAIRPADQTTSVCLMDVLMMQATKSFVTMFQILAMMEKTAQMILVMLLLVSVFILHIADLFVKRITIASNGEQILLIPVNKLIATKPKDFAFLLRFLM
jgi:hypothetical protein